MHKRYAIARLEHLIKVVRRVPRALWNMDTFGGPASYHEHCGTGKCALGWAASDRKFNKAGLKYSGGFGSAITCNSGAVQGSAGRDFFGLSEGQAKRLFYTGFKRSKQFKIGQIRKVIKEIKASA